MMAHSLVRENFDLLNDLAAGTYKATIEVRDISPAAVARANRQHPGASLPPNTHPHTYASLCVAAGIPMFEISRFMGHAKPSTTETVYAHLLRDDHSTAMAALGAIGAPTMRNVVHLRR